MDAVSATLRTGLTPAATKGLSPAELAKTRRAAQDFESLLLAQVLKGMRQASAHNRGPLSGPSHNLYQDMLDEQLANALAKGGGLGLADLLVKDLIRRQAGQKKASSASPSLPIVGPSSTELQADPLQGD